MSHGQSVARGGLQDVVLIHLARIANFAVVPFRPVSWTGTAPTADSSSSATRGAKQVNDMALA